MQMNSQIYCYWYIVYSPGKMCTLLPEVSGCPSLYQVRVGGGMALVSQYREMGLFRTTSFTSPADITPFLWKLGGTEREELVMYASTSNINTEISFWRLTTDDHICT